MTKLANETLGPMQEMLAQFPGRKSKCVSRATYHRWILRGIVMPNGERIRLEATRAGSRWLTSKEACGRFMEACTAASMPTNTDTPIRTPAERKRASDAAGKELAKELAAV